MSISKSKQTYRATFDIMEHTGPRDVTPAQIQKKVQYLIAEGYLPKDTLFIDYLFDKLLDVFVVIVEAPQAFLFRDHHEELQSLLSWTRGVRPPFISLKEPLYKSRER